MKPKLTLPLFFMGSEEINPKLCQNFILSDSFLNSAIKMYLILCKRSNRRVSTRKIESKVFKLYQGDPTIVCIINITFYYRRYSP